MSLTKFNLPGKVSRCIQFDGKVCKIKTLMPPLKDGTISEYVDDITLQEELEDIIRAVLCIPHNVDPVMMRTEHLFVKPEKKEWKHSNKVEFKQHGESLNCLPYMFILNLQLHAAEKQPREEAPIQETVKSMKDNIESKKRKAEGSSSPSKTTAQSKRPKRRLILEEPTSSSSSPRRSNRRMAPTRSSATSSNKPGYILRRRALQLTTSTNNNNNSKKKMQKGDDEEGIVDSRDGWTNRRNRDRIEIDRQERERSPELESGFSRLVQRKVPVGPERFPRVNESGDKEHSHVECTGDQGPMPAWPSHGGAARVGVPGHPGRERVEQHVLEEQLRLQEMASPRGDTPNKEQSNDRGVVHRMYDAVVTPVKKFFSRE